MSRNERPHHTDFCGLLIVLIWGFMIGFAVAASLYTAGVLNP